MCSTFCLNGRQCLSRCGAVERVEAVIWMSSTSAAVHFDFKLTAAWTNGLDLPRNARKSRVLLSHNPPIGPGTRFVTDSESCLSTRKARQTETSEQTTPSRVQGQRDSLSLVERHGRRNLIRAMVPDMPKTCDLGRGSCIRVSYAFKSQNSNPTPHHASSQNLQQGSLH
jgi:hypothetical protein